MGIESDHIKTNDPFNEFRKGKGDLLKVATELSLFVTSLENEASDAALCSIIDGIKAERFHLAVLGNYKRGKSTFINALIGSPLLPMGVIPLTSVVTKMCFREEPIAVVKFSGNLTSEVPIIELSAYVTERENPSNIKGVLEVEVFTDSLYLQNGVIIVDTPGIGSIFLNNTQTTHDFLSHLDAAIVVIGGDPPLGSEELNFVKEIRKYVDKVFFIQGLVAKVL